MKTSTRAQLALAAALSIDLPENASSSEVSELIKRERARREQERTGNHSLPIENAMLAANDGSSTLSVSTGRKLTSIATKIREAGIKPGCVIRVEDDARTYYVHAINAQQMRLVATDLSRVSANVIPTRYPGTDLRIELVFTPPEGFQPPCSFIPIGAPLSKERVQHLISHKRPANDNDVVSTDYGEFWRFRKAI